MAQCQSHNAPLAPVLAVMIFFLSKPINELDMKTLSKTNFSETSRLSSLTKRRRSTNQKRGEKLGLMSRHL
ncbi:hypothetical protein OIU84_026712, partial [Salix udensis]